ncbi:hypothetical protein ACF07D_11665 [Leucobacter sp. NPDC015123]|uniref:hypothetical protein n=1 Tax=Leucobacter sp. NPDC015123 TaxID=3364129 RepID=UPI0036F4862E
MISLARGYSIKACATAAPAPDSVQRGIFRTEIIVLDVVYALGAIALFALIGVVAKAVEKL